MQIIRLAEEAGSQPLVGQIVLEALDLVVDPRTKTLIPNPMSPEMPTVEILLDFSNHFNAKALQKKEINPLRGGGRSCRRPFGREEAVWLPRPGKRGSSYL